MTPAQLRTEILTGPLAAELAPLWAAADDAGAAAVLNRPDRPGYVPARHVVAALVSDPVGFGAGLVWAWKHGTYPDGTAPTALQKTLLARLFFGADNPEYALKYPPGDLETGCAVFGAPDPLKAALLAGEVKVSRAAELGWGVSADAVSLARRTA